MQILAKYQSKSQLKVYILRIALNIKLKNPFFTEVVIKLLFLKLVQFYR